jgi:hypothetical protein
MESAFSPGIKALALGAVAAALCAWATAASTAATPAGCAGFSSQAAAQERFAALGGSPSRDAAGLDVDADGVACEGLPGPYEGFATIAYNLKRRFFYGTASMPPEVSGGRYACLAGNRHFPEGPRLLQIFRVTPGADRVVSRTVGAEAKPAGGRLVWKLQKDIVPVGRYYVAFEEQLRLSPYRPTECPGFRSRETRLPKPAG